MLRFAFWLPLLLLTPAFAGCLTGTDDGVDLAAGASFTPCEHPWPCADGSEWPLNLTVPEDGFGLARVLHVRVPMEDGVELDGAVFLPDVPEGVQVPVILWATPYAGQCRFSEFLGTAVAPTRGQVDDPDCDDAPADSDSEADLGTFLFDYLGRDGYAIAMVNVRGTGLSGGCHDFYGPRSQQDMGALVTWLADQAWSNGRVGMWGLSAMGTTPWMAAIEAPDALKTIAPAGIISDLYLNRFTPQGAPGWTSGVFHAGWAAFNSEVLPLGSLTGRNLNTRWIDATRAMAGNVDDRLCPDAAARLTAGARAQFTDDRGPDFWEDRRLVNRFHHITAATLVMHGFHERGHAFQDDAIWPTLPNAPKRMILGQWGHEIFFDEALEQYPGPNETHTILLEWFDFWLKGVGDPPRLGAVDYQVADPRAEAPGDAAWRTSDAWPPADAAEEVLHLHDARLNAEPGDGASTFRPHPAEVAGPCGGDGAAVGGRTQLRFLTDPVADPVVIAGNPMAYLTIVTDQPGGVFGVSLYDVDPRSGCEAHLVADGAVDLRFHAGNAQGRDFPVGEPTPVRVDLWSTAHRVEPGHRLALVLSGSGDDERLGQPRYAPEVHVDAASHVVLPLVEGTLGGAAPTFAYPPRPWVPDANPADA